LTCYVSDSIGGASKIKSSTSLELQNVLVIFGSYLGAWKGASILMEAPQGSNYIAFDVIFKLILYLYSSVKVT